MEKCSQKREIKDAFPTTNGTVIAELTKLEEQELLRREEEHQLRRQISNKRKAVENLRRASSKITIDDHAPGLTVKDLPKVDWSGPESRTPLGDLLASWDLAPLEPALSFQLQQMDQLDHVLRDTMKILAPAKSRTIILLPNAPWCNEHIGNEKRKQRRLERRWRSSRLELDRLSYIEQCSVVNTMLYKDNEFYCSSVNQDKAHDTRLLFRSTVKLLKRQTEKHYPSADNDQQLANDFADFFTAEIERISEELVLRKSGLVHSPGPAKPTCLSRLSEFDLVTNEEVLKLIRGSIIKACKLDPLPATIMRSCYSALVLAFKTVINLSLSMPVDLKIAFPLAATEEAKC